MENGQEGVALEQPSVVDGVELMEATTTGVEGEQLQTPTKSTHSSAADDDSHLMTQLPDNKESK